MRDHKADNAVARTVKVGVDGIESGEETRNCHLLAIRSLQKTVVAAHNTVTIILAIIESRNWINPIKMMSIEKKERPETRT